MIAIQIVWSKSLWSMLKQVISQWFQYISKISEMRKFIKSWTQSLVIAFLNVRIQEALKIHSKALPKTAEKQITSQFAWRNKNNYIPYKTAYLPYYNFYCSRLWKIYDGMSSNLFFLSCSKIVSSACRGKKQQAEIWIFEVSLL